MTMLLLGALRRLVKPYRIRNPRTAKLGGKVFLRYSGAHLRAIRRIKGVGRPPRKVAA